jgi:protein-S-isoprenylcysteine O-methyltransferase Ste14
VAALDLQQLPTGSEALVVTVVAFSIGELAQVRRVRRGANNVDVGAEVVFRLGFLTGILTLPLATSIAPGARIPWPEAALVVGVAVAWLGLVVRWWSFRTLGQYFTLVLLTSPDQAVVDRGPYRVLRHPSYTGLLMVVLGCALMIGNWVGVLACSAWVGGAIVYRIRVEECALTEALGAAYLDFAATRARLVPFVW